MTDYRRHILALDDDGLEEFVFAWMRHLTKGYAEVERFSGAGDMGRDDVGFLTRERHEGPWHNYQCKQLGRTLQPGSVLLEIGKVLHFSHIGAYLPPTGYVFVAPRGASRTAEHLIFNPSVFQTTLLERWDEVCAGKIERGTNHLLTASLRSHIEAFDFSSVSRIDVGGILADTASMPALVAKFGADPGPPPLGKVPDEVQDFEAPYVRELIDAYEERDGCNYPSHHDVSGHPDHGPHLRYQRERFFQADAFNRFYRDITLPEHLDALQDDVLHGVLQAYNSAHADGLSRVEAVMDKAASVQPAGPLATHARVPIKQGICHHFANEGKMKWRR